jgi:hypothetical protein
MKWIYGMRTIGDLYDNDKMNRVIVNHRDFPILRGNIRSLDAEILRC